MDMFNKILKNMEETYTLEEEREREREREEKKEIEAKSIAEVSMKNTIENINEILDICYSKELYSLMLKYGFKIDKYIQVVDSSSDDYFENLYHNPDQLVETYFCSYNCWKFEIHNYSDCDISEGIYKILHLRNLNTNEKYDIYLDLGCRNTGEARLTRFLKLISSNSMEDFINTEYKLYLELPNLLKSKGIDNETVDYTFSLMNVDGYIKLNNNINIRVYRAWLDDFKLVITNDSTWDVNSYNSVLNYRYDSFAYFFDYKDERDIDELIKCLKSFEEHLKGNIGFFENGEYYSNYDIHFVYDNIIEEFKNKNYDYYNHYLFRYEEHDETDCRGYKPIDSQLINKYNGLELYHRCTLTFNDAAQWSVGETINNSVIEIIYDKRIDENNCILNIKNYSYKESDDYILYSEDEEDYHTEYNDKFLVDTITIKDSYLNLTKVIEDYMNDLYNTFDTYIKRLS